MQVLATILSSQSCPCHCSSLHSSHCRTKFYNYYAMARPDMSTSSNFCAFLLWLHPSASTQRDVNCCPNTRGHVIGEWNIGGQVLAPGWLLQISQDWKFFDKLLLLWMVWHAMNRSTKERKRKQCWRCYHTCDLATCLTPMRWSLSTLLKDLSVL